MVASVMPRATPDAGGDEVAGLVMSLLAGLVSEADAATKLGIGRRDLRSLLEQYGLADAAMLPCRVDDQLALTYIDIGRDSFAAPRFDDVVERHKADPPPGRAVFRLPAPDMVRAGARVTGPAGIIAHVGRCGSTLLCNLLAATGGWAAIKEPEVVNRLLLRRANEPDETRQDMIGALVAGALHSLAHGVRRDAAGAARHCVVKLSSWNLLFADAFVGRLASTPVVMLTRDPWATVASSLQQLPDWYRAASDMPAPDDRVALARLFATEWSRIVDAALDLPGAPLFIRYEALIDDPQAVLGAVRRRLGDDRANAPDALGAVMRQYSKAAGQEPFEPGGVHRRDMLDGDLRDVVTTITAASWARLRGRE